MLNLRTFAPLSLLALLACDRGTPTPTPTPAPVVASVRVDPQSSAKMAAAMAAPALSVAKVQGPRVSVVTALKGKKGQSMRLSLEREGDELRGYLLQDSVGQGELMKGKMLDGQRFKLTESGRQKTPGTLEGELSGTTVSKLSWHEGKGKAVALTTAPLSPFGKEASKATDEGYSGSIGDKLRVRAQIKREGKQLSGYYRYARSRDDLKLAGSVDPDTGKFEMSEIGPKGSPTGKLKGTFLDARHLVGSWESPDGTRSMPLLMAGSQPLPKVQELPGGGKVIPRESEKQLAPHCTRTNLFAEFDGLSDKKAQDALNKQLNRGSVPGKNEKEMCDGATAELPYTFDEQYSVVSTKHKGYVGMLTSGYEYTGGAHGMPYSRCSVADLSSGKLIELHTLLAPESRDKLTALVNKKLREEHKVTDLTEVGFFDSAVKLGEQPDLCLHDDGAELVFSVYEVAPYVMGTPTVSLSFAELKPLMKKDPAVDAMMR